MAGGMRRVRTHFNAYARLQGAVCSSHRHFQIWLFWGDLIIIS